MSERRKTQHHVTMEQCCANGTTNEPQDAHIDPVSETERTIIAILVAIAGALGIAGNTVVILAVILFKKLRTSTNVFVVNLCVSNWITCINMPWMVLAIVNTEPKWPLPDWICVSCGFMAISCIGCSTFTLAFIALNRLIMITSHAKLYPKLFKQLNIILMLLFIWCIPLTLASIPLVSSFGQLGYDYEYRTCTWDTSNPHSDSYSLMLAVTFTPIQFVAIILCYFKIFQYIRRHSRKLRPALADNPPLKAPAFPRVPAANDLAQLRAAAPGDAPVALRNAFNKRQVQVTKNMFYVVCGFVICLMPFGVSLMIDVKNNGRLVFYAAVFLISSCFINPIIYCTKHPDFKSAMIKIVKCRYP